MPNIESKLPLPPINWSVSQNSTASVKLNCREDNQIKLLENSFPTKILECNDLELTLSKKVK